MMKKVLIMVPCDQTIKDKLEVKFGQDYEFCFAYGDEMTIEENLPHAEIIIGEPNEEQILKARCAKWIQLTWAGVDKYSKMANVPSGLCITNASGAFGNIIAEYIVGNIISVYRGFPQYWESKKAGRWEPGNSNSTIFGKEVLILGTGDIGTCTAKRLKAFDARITGIRRNVGEGALDCFDEVCGLDKLEKLLPNVDIIVGCLPNTMDTQGVLDYQRIKSMKQDAVIINVGRGTLINTEDLVKALAEGHLKGVALDVFEKEPLDDNSPLWAMENVIITPHIAGPSFGGNKDVENAIWKICIDNLGLYLDRKRLKNVVNLKQGY
ncbi:MAG: D-2-hydroxyacid dehydrogenase [Firmicutes bacterium]|nr:D-2-hydroxyacid dehydrogenase [Bacillota bacterium]